MGNSDRSAVKRPRVATAFTVLAALAAALALTGAWLRNTSVSQPRVGSSAVELLVDRDRVFPAALEMIGAAKREILVNVYLLGGEAQLGDRPAGIGRRIVDALAERRAAGIDVRIINQRMRQLPDRREHTISGDPWFVPVFEYARRRGLAVVPPCTQGDSIDHNKYIIVDGRKALFGGMNFAEAVASNHDLMVRVQGSLVTELRDQFAQSWSCAVAAAQQREPAEATVSELRASLASPAEIEMSDTSDHGVQQCATTLLLTSPDRQTILPGLLAEIKSLGRGDELMVSMLLLTEPRLIEAIVEAERRSVQVRVLLDPNSAFYGVDCRTAYNAAAIAALADAGIDVRLYQAEPGQELHIKAVAARHDGSAWFGLGSANWTQNAMTKHRESYAIFHACPALADEVWQVFELDWKSRSRIPSAETLDAYRDPKRRRELRTDCRRRLRADSFDDVIR